MNELNYIPGYVEGKYWRSARSLCCHTWMVYYNQRLGCWAHWTGTGEMPVGGLACRYCGKEVKVETTKPRTFAELKNIDKRIEYLKAKVARLEEEVDSLELLLAEQEKVAVSSRKVAVRMWKEMVPQYIKQQRAGLELTGWYPWLEPQGGWEEG